MLACQIHLVSPHTGWNTTSTSKDQIYPGTKSPKEHTTSTAATRHDPVLPQLMGEKESHSSPLEQRCGKVWDNKGQKEVKQKVYMATYP